VGAIALLYLFVVSVGAAMWITGKPRAAVHPWAVPHRDVQLTAPDGVRLAAWYVPGRNGAAVVLVHGGGGSRDGVKLHADMLLAHGYGVLLYDERGRGASGGRSNAFGWDWPQDVETAVTYLERQGVRHVGVLGLSTGAEVALTAAAEDHRIAAVVADGTEARTLDDFAHQSTADRWTSLPYWAVTTLAVRVIRRTDAPPPLSQVMRRVGPRPLLLVQSNDAAEQELAPVWARADGRPGVLWHVDASHTKGLATHPAAYERHVLGLFDRALLGRSARGATGYSAIR
jgi:pimeloyl-ACP methyl ester carboxylesterase